MPRAERLHNTKGSQAILMASPALLQLCYTDNYGGSFARPVAGSCPSTTVLAKPSSGPHLQLQDGLDGLDGHRLSARHVARVEPVRAYPSPDPWTTGQASCVVRLAPFAELPALPTSTHARLEDLKIRTRVRIADRSNVPLTEYIQGTIIAHADMAEGLMCSRCAVLNQAT